MSSAEVCHGLHHLRHEVCVTLTAALLGKQTRHREHGHHLHTDIAMFTFLEVVEQICEKLWDLGFKEMTNFEKMMIMAY